MREVSIAKTGWANPLKEGRDGGKFEVMIRFGLQALDLGTAKLVKRLRKLEGKHLVSDQGREELCHAKLRSAMYHLGRRNITSPYFSLEPSSTT